MTWEEIDKKYNKEKRNIPLLDRAAALEKNWGRLVRSTDKLIWLFTISDNWKPKLQNKTGSPAASKVVSGRGLGTS